jgi:hypothetical protein
MVDMYKGLRTGDDADPLSYVQLHALKFVRAVEGLSTSAMFYYSEACFYLVCSILHNYCYICIETLYGI